jgi:hypothetical protein
MPLPPEFSDWVKQFPISPENKKIAEEFLNWLKENNNPIILQPTKIKVTYNIGAFQEMKKILQDNKIDLKRK